MPLIRLQRFRDLDLAKSEINSTVITFLNDELTTCINRLRDGNQILDSNIKVKQRWARLLYSSVDGAPLKDSSKVPQQHSWIIEGNRLVSGRDYSNMVKMRINALPVRARIIRERTMGQTV